MKKKRSRQEEGGPSRRTRARQSIEIGKEVKREPPRESHEGGVPIGALESSSGASCVSPEVSAQPTFTDAKEAEGGESEKAQIRLKDQLLDSIPSPSIVNSLSLRVLESVADLGIDEDLEIVQSICNAYERKDFENLDNVLANACQELARSPMNPSKYYCLSCLYVSKKLPEAFGLPKTFKVLLDFFRAEEFQNIPKNLNLLPLIASKLLMRAFESEPHWPMDFVKAYLEDSFGLQYWIESEGCREFVDNILTAFSDIDLISKLNRYPSDDARKSIQQEFIQSLYLFLEAQSSKENPHQLLNLLLQGAAYGEVRVLASSMLEGWLGNPVHSAGGKALLDRIIEHTHGLSEHDLNTIANLLTLQISSTQASGQIKSLHGSIYSDMITSLTQQRLEYANLALKTFVIAEMSCNDQVNLESITIVLRALPDSPPPEHQLALVLQEQALNEESMPHLKEFIRRMMKHISQDINIYALCQGLLQPWPAIAEQEDSLKKFWLNQMVELTTWLLLYTIVPLASDEKLVQVFATRLDMTQGANSSAFTTVSNEKLGLLEKFSLDLASFQIEAMAWCTDVFAAYRPDSLVSEFKSVVRMFLFLEDQQAHMTKSYGDTQMEMNAFRLLGSCTRSSEEILARLIVMGISNIFPLTQRDSLDIIYELVCRASTLQTYMNGMLFAENTQLPLAILKLASLNLPGVSRQSLMQLVFKDRYWQACFIVLVLSLNNLQRIGIYAWRNIPSVRSMMEALLTNQSGGSNNVPPSENMETEASFWDQKAEEMVAKFWSETKQSDTGFDGIERNAVLGLDIREWKGNVTLLNLLGGTRPLPDFIIEKLVRLEEQHCFGQRLRKSRDPDFLKEVTSLQALPQVWWWLKKLLFSEPDLVELLPLNLQIEILYTYEGIYSVAKKHEAHLPQLYSRLRNVFFGQPVEGEIKVIINTLCSKLKSRNSRVRSQVRRCFAGLLSLKPSNSSQIDPILYSVSATEGLSWLETLIQVPSQGFFIDLICAAVGEALQQETSIEVVIAYVSFLKQHSSAPSSSFPFVCCMANLVTSRRSLISTLLRESQTKTSRMTCGSGFSAIQACVESLKCAIEVEATTTNTMEQQHVILVSPQYSCSEKTSLFARVSLPKIIVDAAIQLVSLLSSELLCLGVVKPSYERIVQVLFPGFFQLDWTEMPRMAWLETESGKELSLLSTKQAIAFVRSNDHRLIQAGITLLSVRERLELCTQFSLSEMSAVALLDSFDHTDNDLLAFELRSASFSNLAKLKSSINLLCKISSNKASKLLRIMDEITCSTLNYSASTERFVCKRKIIKFSFELSNANTENDHYEEVPLEETINKLFLISEKTPLASAIICYELRKILPIACCSGNDNNILVSFLRILQAFNQLDNAASWWIKLFLPLLSMLASFRPLLVHHQNWSNSDSSFSIEFENALRLTFANIRSITSQASAVSLYLPSYSEYSLFIVKELENLLLNHTNQLDIHTDTSFSITCDHFFAIPLDEVEFFLHKCMSIWLASLQNNYKESEEFKSFIGNLLLLLQKSNNIGEAHDFKVNYKIFGFSKDVGMAGYCGLLHNVLKYFDPLTIFEEESMNCVSLINIAEVQLLSVLHDYSWNDKVKATGILLTSLTDLFYKYGFLHSGPDKPQAAELPREVLIFMSTFVDLIYGFLNHPQICLQIRGKNNSCKLDSNNSIAFFLFTPSVVQNISSLAVGILTSCIMNTRRAVSEKINPIYVSKAIKILLIAASHTDHNLHQIYNHLCILKQGLCQGTDLILTVAAKNATSELLWRLYYSAPLLLKTRWLYDVKNESVASDLNLGLHISYGNQHVFGQTSCIAPVIYAMLHSIFSPNGKHIDTTYRFCQNLVRNHPILFLPFMRIIRVLLKDLLPSIKTQNNEQRLQIANSLMMGLGFLDALRPCILLVTNFIGSARGSKQTIAEELRVEKQYLEPLLSSVYFHFLAMIEPQDAPHYAKVVARLADFLCHCALHGGKCYDIVAANRDALQRTAEKFKKIKKLSFLLGLLDSPDALDKKLSLMPPSLPQDEMQRIQKQLTYFISGGTDDKSTQLANSTEKYPNDSDLKMTIMDLASASARVPSILQGLEDPLIKLMKISKDDIQDSIVCLLERLLIECPSEENTTKVVEGVIQLLQSDNTETVRSASKLAVRFLCYCPDLQETMLQEMFQSSSFDVDILQCSF